MENYPPYSITDKMLNYVSDIMKKIGETNYFESLNRYPELRRKSRIKSIHSSLAIENNQLSLFQVEDVINGKPVIGEQKDIQEVKNAYEAYEQIDKVNPYSVDDLKKIHGILTFLIEKDAGKFRNHGEAVYDGDIQIFMAPPYKMVPTLIDNLFNWMNEVKNTINPLILSSIFHYEFVFIHPFHDGNGRTGRIINILWLVQERLLHRPILFLSKYYLDNKAEYYERLKNVTTNNDWEQWIVYVLKSIEETAQNTSLMIDKILLARNMYKEELQKYFRKIYSADLLDVIFSSPYFRIENFSGVFPVISRQTASKHLNMLCQEYEREDGTKGQLLTVQKSGRENIYFNQVLFEILTNK